MKRFHLPAYSHIRLAKARLKRGGIIAYATESCFGLGCLPSHHRALKRLLRIKKRPAHKGMIVVGANPEQLQSFMAPLTGKTQHYIKQHWPGHYTLLLHTSRRVLPHLRGIGQDRIALRLTAEPNVAALCHALGTPLVSTSANIAKQRTLKQARDCRKQFGYRVLALPGKIGKHAMPSTIIDTISGQILRS
ncbi:MAG: L-threonylcarbamoyladenylate synthase [Neisseriales bacterium]|nr:MAG: L-threonylcarbamoyladenylate synthase [Neisseriales bacterium]